MIPADGLGEPANLRERAEVGEVELRAGIATLAQLVDDGLAPLPVAAVDQRRCSRRAEFERHMPPHPIGGAGDQNGLAAELHAHPHTATRLSTLLRWKGARETVSRVLCRPGRECRGH